MEYNINQISPSLKKLASSYDTDKKDIQDYYISRKKFNWNYLNDILKFFSKLFFIDYDEKFSLIKSIVFGILFNVFLFYIYSIILKLGLNYSFFPISILITFGIFLYYNIISKFQGILLNLVFYFCSIILVNHSVYNASKEGMYKKEYCNIVQKDNITENQFFIENLQTFNNKNYKLIKYD